MERVQAAALRKAGPVGILVTDDKQIKDSSGSCHRCGKCCQCSLLDESPLRLLLQASTRDSGGSAKSARKCTPHCKRRGGNDG